MSDRRSSACADFQRTQLTRRHLLQVGGAGLLGLSLPRLLRAAERGGARHQAKAKAVIFLHQYGGPSHHDTVDMKPNAPAQVRGEYKPIPTTVPGLQICELLPRVAGVMNKCTLVRSLTHTMKNHNSAGYYTLTRQAPPADRPRAR